MKLHIKIVLTTIVTLLLLIYLAGFFPIFSQAPTNWVITGRIMAPSPETTEGTAVNNAILTLTDIQGEIHIVTTGEDGYYYFSNLAVDANSVITAIAIVNGKTMVFKDVIPYAVAAPETYDAGTNVLVDLIREGTTAQTEGTYTITASFVGSGTIEPSGAVTVNHGLSQTFTIIPDSNYHIDDVLVDGKSVSVIEDGKYTFTDVTADHIIYASFAINTYTLTMNTDADGTGSGSVIPTVGVHTYNYGDTVTISATADATSSDFSEWSGDAFGTSDEILTMTENKDVTATFTLKTYILTVNIDGAGTGTVAVDPVKENYDHGDIVTISATADVISSDFSGWSGDAFGTTDATLIMDFDKSVIATFNLKKVTLTMAVAETGSGTVIPAEGVHTYNYGDVVLIKAKSNTGYFASWRSSKADAGSIFTGWSTNENIDNTAKANTRVTMNGHQTVTATFTKKETCTLTMDVDGTGSGTVSPAVGEHIYNYEDKVDIKAKAGTDSDFTGWSTNENIDNTTQANTRVTMNAAQTIIATFALKTYILTMKTGGAGVGTITVVPDKETYNHGDTVTISALADPTSSDFVRWLHNKNLDKTNKANTKLTMNSDQTVTAIFTKKKTSTLTMTVTGTGSGTTVPAEDGTYTYSYGKRANIKAKAGKGSEFTGWITNENIDNTAEANTRVTMNGPQTVTATFTKKRTCALAMSVDGTGSGTVSPAKGDHTYDHGDKVNIRAKASKGSEFTGWSTNKNIDKTTKANTKVTMNGDQTVTATFNLKTYTVTASTGENGSIDPSGEVTVDYGSDQSFTITPTTGYHIADVLVDGKSKKSVSSYTFKKIRTDHTIEATFAGDLHHFDFATISSPQTAGTEFTITITAKDVDGNTVTGYTAKNTLSVTGNTISPDETKKFSNGVWTGDVTITTPQAGVSITTVGDGKTGTSNIFDVTAGVLHHFDIVLLTEDPKYAGVPFSITITAKDANDNIATGYTGTGDLSDTTETISPIITGSFASGEWTGNVTITEARNNVEITIEDSLDSQKTGKSDKFKVESQ